MPLTVAADAGVDPLTAVSAGDESSDNVARDFPFSAVVSLLLLSSRLLRAATSLSESWVVRLSVGVGGRLGCPPLLLRAFLNFH